MQVEAAVSVNQLELFVFYHRQSITVLFIIPFNISMQLCMKRNTLSHAVKALTDDEGNSI